ncbi:MFS transporter [Gorillibacterium timonense]|uniref:MFS transporter n=1 Tax=Gorillibacterium timonense TaxID=1689269 RepID=UPI00071CE301|nr:MFS transporter [Gorillibacterium timonense]
MDYVEIGSRTHRRAAIGMLLGSIVSFAIMYSPQPLISLFSKEYGISAGTAGLAVSVTTMALSVSLLFVSILSNRWGRKLIMSVSLLSTSILAIASAFVHDFQLFLVIRFLEGISVAGFPSVAMAYLNEEFSPKSIGKIMGIYVAGTSIGGFVGRIVIGALTDLFSWQISLVMLGSISLLCSLWFWLYLPASRNFAAKKTSLSVWSKEMLVNLRNRDLLRLFAIGFLLMGIYISVLNYIGYPLTHAPYNLSQTVFGFLFVVNLAGTYSSLLFGRLADRFPRSHVLGFAMAIFTAGVLLTLNHLLVLKIIGVALVAFGFFAAHSVASGWVGILASREHKAHASSCYLLFYYAGSSLIGWSGGTFLTHYSWNGLVYYLCALIAIVFLLAYRSGGTTLPVSKRVAGNPRKVGHA